MRWAGHVVLAGEMRRAYKVLVIKSEGKRPLIYLSVDGRIILEWFLGKLCEKLWSRFMWLRIELL
jgi:hypothetical protein